MAPLVITTFKLKTGFFPSLSFKKRSFPLFPSLICPSSTFSLFKCHLMVCTNPTGHKTSTWIEILMNMESFDTLCRFLILFRQRMTKKSFESSLLCSVCMFSLLSVDETTSINYYLINNLRWSESSLVPKAVVTQNQTLQDIK